MDRVNLAVSAATKLALFTEGKLQLTAEHYDALCDTLIDLLESSRNEAYRLLELGEDTEPGTTILPRE